LSIYQELGEPLALMGNVGWQNWREFGQMILGFDGGADQTVTTDRNFEDTWHFSIGGHYRVHELHVLQDQKLRTSFLPSC